ncbi:MAG: DUF1573 domain-containing protein [Planctomycetaceae bacterium]|jgi:hypothetical protein|nr:DUF1573 domain-containing protein [Planctomycetaceae bacterium]
MFAETRFDFGRVALRTSEEHRFEFENVWEQDVRIVSVRSSCTCTSVSFEQPIVKSLEKGYIVAKLNTNGQHLRDVSATITVTLELRVGERILREAVQLDVKGYIRSDVILTPGIIDFGVVVLGKEDERKLRIEYRGGRSDWKITDIVRDNPFVHARAEEVKRNSREVVYDVVVKLKSDTPAGYVNDILRFVTNDKQTVIATTNSNENVNATFISSIQLPVRGNIVAPLQVKPSPFLIGVLSPNEKVIKSIIVRNDATFRILNVTSSDPRFKFTFSNTERPLQLISVMFTSSRNDDDEDLERKIIIKTNLPKNETISIDVKGFLYGNKTPQTISTLVRDEIEIDSWHAVSQDDVGSKLTNKIDSEFYDTSSVIFGKPNTAKTGNAGLY